MQSIRNIRIAIFSLILFMFLYYHNNKVKEYNNLRFEKDIYPIIFFNCTPCHNPTGIAPFSLLTSYDFYKNSKMIKEVIKKDIMPPWLPNPRYSTFKNQRVLKTKDANKILNFIKYNKKYNKNKNSISINNKIQKNICNYDTIIKLSSKNTFKIDGNNKDKFMNFYLPFDIEKDYWLKGIELVSSNKKLVHHAWLFQSKEKIVDSLKTKLSKGVASGFDDWNKFEPLYGYLPGFSSSFYENDLSKKIQINSNLFLQIHYYSTPFAQEDSTYVKLYLSKIKPKNELKYLIINEDYLNKELKIPKNKVRKFKGQYIIQQNMILYSIIPHMHFRGKKIKAQIILPNNKRINLIEIENWNFNNQENYIFENRIKAPKGSKIIYTAVFDNTKNNINNPIIPPIDVFLGETSNDEMLQLIFEYYNY
jgi:hypothetical protein